VASSFLLAVVKNAKLPIMDRLRSDELRRMGVEETAIERGEAKD
jgi:hypothetical protein